MKEIREILNRMATFSRAEKAVLATVVELKGSGYRLPGARMLIMANGDAVGTVSGGCLEADVLERSRRVLESGTAEIFIYDTSADENSVFSLNMGCRGIMRIFMEPVDAASPIVEILRISASRRTPITVATAIASETEKIRVGSRIFAGVLNGKGETSLIDKDGILKLAPQMEDDLLTFSGSRSVMETIKDEVDGRLVEFSFETLQPPVRLAILGAGADAVPLADIAFTLGWQTSVYDHRPAFLTRERFPDAEQLVHIDRDSPIELAADRRTAFVSMNHNYDRDKLMIAAALSTDAFYTGALGPRKRTDQILEELGQTGVVFNEARLKRLRAPAGLDIGADTPETIAAAIIAEIQSVLRERKGGPLQDRQAPIYDRK